MNYQKCYIKRKTKVEICIQKLNKKLLQKQLEIEKVFGESVRNYRTPVYYRKQNKSCQKTMKLARWQTSLNSSHQYVTVEVML